METDRTEKITHIHDIHVTHTGFEVAIRARRTRTVGGGVVYLRFISKMYHISGKDLRLKYFIRAIGFGQTFK